MSIKEEVQNMVCTTGYQKILKEHQLNYDKTNMINR